MIVKIAIDEDNLYSRVVRKESIPWGWSSCNTYAESEYFWFKKGANKRVDRGSGWVGCFSRLYDPVYLCECAFISARVIAWAQAHLWK